jgi:two-component system, NtrC family, response regulator AtoC
MAERIIIVEDDPGVRFFLEEALGGEGYFPFSFESYEEARDAMNQGIALVIIDIRLPGIDGLTAIDDIRVRTDAPILVITAHGTKKNALEAIRRGAADFFVKPIALDELKVMVKRTIATRKLEKELAQLRDKETVEAEFHGVIGKSREMRAIFRDVEKIADKDVTVLVTGETGTGKEEIAGLMHRLSGRKGALVIVNCASIPDALLESELFGFEKGAFTGAHQQKPGKFEMAEGGSIVLDEIGEMSPYLQAKLLRVVEAREVERLGDTRRRKVNIRVAATTNRELSREMKEGRFREDLFFRLSQIHIHVPPLRERIDDIVPLSNHFLGRMSREDGVLYRIDDQVGRILLGYAWPGNTRELLNVLKRASILCEKGLITEDDLPLYLKSGEDLTACVLPGKSLDEAISDFEKQHIVEALKETKGSQAKAAKLLGISERSMWYRVKKYAIETGPEGA